MEIQGFDINKNVEFVGKDHLRAAENASAIVVATEWTEFNEYDYAQVIKVMAQKPAIFDLRCYLDKRNL